MLLTRLEHIMRHGGAVNTRPAVCSFMDLTLFDTLLCLCLVFVIVLTSSRRPPSIVRRLASTAGSNFAILTNKILYVFVECSMQLFLLYDSKQRCGY